MIATCPCHRYYMFQFHNGSIKSENKVKGYTLDTLFQFHNGSIKSFPLLKDSSSSLFQFHNGSIKSCQAAIAQLHKLLSFNSTMVRLKADLPSSHKAA